jgi:Ribonuclease HI
MLKGKGFFDGLCEPVNPGGIATYGYVVLLDGRNLEGYGLASPPWSPNSTNNVAEYTGLICLLRRMLQERVDEAEVMGDSQLVVRQINGEYKVKSEKIIPLFNVAKELLSRFRRVEVKWIPREENSYADLMTRKAYELAKRGELDKVGC